MASQNSSVGKDPSLSVEQMLRLILSHLQGFPVERFVRMETDLQNLKSLLQEESKSRKVLAEELHGLTLGLQETIDKRMDRAFDDCRQDRDLRLTHLGDRIESMQGQGQQERAFGIRMKIAMFGAGSAVVISAVNAMINLFVRK